MSIWDRLRPASLAPTPSDAGRALNAARIAADRARRTATTATTDTLRAFVAAGGVSKLGWK